MPVFKSTKGSWIIGTNSRHADIIEEMTSQEQLIKPQSVESLGYYTMKVDTHSADKLRPLSEGQGSHSGLGQCSTEGNKESSYFQIQDPSPVKNIKQQETSPSKRAIKNLLVLGCAFMFMFTAFVSLQSLQSTLNAHRGVGVVSLACAYGATVCSCFFAPAVIGRLKTKGTILASYVLFLVYILTNFYPRPFVMLPASVLLGTLTGPLWSAQSTYLTTLAIRHAQSSGQLHEAMINKFNGVFCGILQTSQVWGNLLSATILSADNGTVHQNRMNASRTRLVCGARDCGLKNEFPDDYLPHFVGHVTWEARTLLLCIHAGCAVMAIVLTLALLDSNQSNTTDNDKSMSLSSQQLFFATVRIMQDPRLQMLVPLVIFTGVEQGFVLGDFTKSYVNCALGIHKIGYVLMCFGAVNSVSSVCIGHVAKHLKRYPIMVSGTLFNTGLLLVLLWWRPVLDDVPMYYVISSCLGLCDAIWQTQTNTLFGVLFAENQEAAFACYRMFQAIGLATAFGYSYFLCVSTKVYIMGGLLVLGLTFYSAIEYKLLQQRKYRQGIVVL